MLPFFLLLPLTQIPDLPGTPTPFVEMRILDIEKGSGAPAQPGQEFTVHYTGWLRDGKKFDSSRDRNQPLKFIQGRRRVIAGWEAGFEGMQVGGKRRLFIPYQMAYGEKGRGAIPPKAELIFDVELLAAENVPDPIAAQDLIHPFESYSTRLLSLLASLPDNKLDWRPTPSSRSFREAFLHIATRTKLLLATAQSEPIPAAPTASTKAELTTLLNQSFDAVRRTLPTLRQAILDRETPVFGQPSTIRGYYILLNAELAETLGQLSTYATLP